jgi:hypothetical protein
MPLDRAFALIEGRFSFAVVPVGRIDCFLGGPGPRHAVDKTAASSMDPLVETVLMVDAVNASLSKVYVDHASSLT